MQTTSPVSAPQTSRQPSQASSPQSVAADPQSVFQFSDDDLDLGDLDTVYAALNASGAFEPGAFAPNIPHPTNARPLTPTPFVATPPTLPVWGVVNTLPRLLAPHAAITLRTSEDHLVRYFLSADHQGTTHVLMVAQVGLLQDAFTQSFGAEGLTFAQAQAAYVFAATEPVIQTTYDPQQSPPLYAPAHNNPPLTREAPLWPHDLAPFVPPRTTPTQDNPDTYDRLLDDAWADVFGG